VPVIIPRRKGATVKARYSPDLFEAVDIPQSGGEFALYIGGDRRNRRYTNKETDLMHIFTPNQALLARHSVQSQTRGLRHQSLDHDVLLLYIPQHPLNLGIV
jgi:hypothetical protein